jgi:uncharacterized protein (DUF983 family)
MRFWAILIRSMKLRCPRCGRGKLFSGFFRMHDHCDTCGLPYHRGDGYYLGAIYFNYGVTAILVIALFFTLFLVGDVSPDVMIWPLFAFCLLFPLAFFRHSRSLWRGFDELLDPCKDDAEKSISGAAHRNE